MRYLRDAFMISRIAGSLGNTNDGSHGLLLVSSSHSSTGYESYTPGFLARRASASR